MAAQADTTGQPGTPATGQAGTSRRARRAERSPSGGWRTIAAKELADHLESVRFIVLLVVIGIASIVPLYFVSTDISSAAPQLAGSPALFMALFVVGSNSVGGVTTVAFAALLVPLVGIAFGFDGINSERSQGTLARLLSQPIHRDDIINGKFAAGIGVIALMLTALVALVTALGIVRLGIIPTPEELARVVAWLLTTILYASFWLAFALVLSVVLRGAASAALVGFGTWLGLTVFGQFLLPLVAGFLFPATTTTLDIYQYTSVQAQQVFLRLSPTMLYQDIVHAVMDPTAKTVLDYGNVGQAISAQEQLPTLLSLDQSILLVWPQIVALVALTVAMFALAYVLFLRQEVRS
jgi:ABC-2 type transport system permease protein